MSLRYDVIELRDVSSRPDVRHVRLEEFVRPHAHVGLETCALEDVDVHGEAEADAHQVGGRAETLRADDLEPAVRALEPVDRFVVVEMHAGVLREERDDLAALLVERTPKEPWAPHEPVRLEPAV